VQLPNMQSALARPSRTLSK